MNGDLVEGLTKDELARHLGHEETRRLVAWSRAIGVDALALLLGVSRATVRSLIGWRGRRKDLAAARRALASVSVVAGGCCA